MVDKPLISFTLLTYNQQDYIGQSVRNALAQTYTPLEVIVSDDCSTDSTFDRARSVLNQMATVVPGVGNESTVENTAECIVYEMPGKRIVLRRNRVNEGIIFHCHKVFAMTHGEYIIPSAGDDYSVPDRVERVVAAWLANDRKSAAILHQAHKIDPEGRMLGALPLQTLDVPLGCGTNYRRDVITAFPPITVRGSSDDWVYVRRARMIGEVAFLPDELVMYRVGSGVSSVLHDNRGPALRSQKGILKSLEQSRIDLEYIKPEIADSVYQEQLAEIDMAMKKAAAYVELLSAPKISARFAAFRAMREPSLKGRLLQSVYILPPTLADFLLSLYLRFKNHHS